LDKKFLAEYSTRENLAYNKFLNNLIKKPKDVVHTYPSHGRFNGLKDPVVHAERYVYSFDQAVRKNQNDDLIEKKKELETIIDNVWSEVQKMESHIRSIKSGLSFVFGLGGSYGTKTIILTPKEGIIHLEALWYMKLSGMMGMFTGIVKKHIQSGTEQALQSIKQEAER
jgi:hypothetical protein